jgi:type IV pilus assembly protein PilE
MRPRFRFQSGRQRGVTLTEMLTGLVVLVVLAAITVTMWRSHELEVRRGDAREALLALQSAQDRYFGDHARYADETRLVAEPPEGLGINPVSRLGYFEVTARNSEDDLGYWAMARAIDREGQSPDPRCMELRIDQNGRRFAIDADGVDRSADCWR